MNTYLVIGAPGTGKSPFVRKLIGDDKRCYIFDVANEYGTRVKYAGQTPMRLSNNPKDLRSRMDKLDVKNFIAGCETKKDTICVFEEATGFFQGKMGLETTRLIVNRYHTGNNYVFIFHSINSVPPRIYEMANYVVLFKTTDQVDTVYRKFNRLGVYFNELQQAPLGESRIIKLI